MTADVRLVLPRQHHPRALELAEAAYQSTSKVFLLVPPPPGAGVDWRGAWSGVSPMAVRIPNDLKVNVVHVTEPSHARFHTAGMVNLALTDDQSLAALLSEAKDEWYVVMLSERKSDGAAFDRWLSLVL